MAIGSTVAAAMKNGPFQTVLPGSMKSDWVVANNDTKTTQSAAELLNPVSTNDSNVTPVTIPDGASGFLWRVRIPIAVTTLTTDPVIRWYGVDETTSLPVPLRLDATASNAAGIEVDISGTAPSSTLAQDATYYYSPVYSRTPTDTLGCKTLYCLIETASTYTDGATSQSCSVIVKFTN